MFQVVAGSLSGPCVSLLRVDELLLPSITRHIVLLAFVFIPITWLLDLFANRTEIQWLRDLCDGCYQFVLALGAAWLGDSYTIAGMWHMRGLFEH